MYIHTGGMLYRYSVGIFFIEDRLILISTLASINDNNDG